jgi:hypothetical protein
MVMVRAVRSADCIIIQSGKWKGRCVEPLEEDLLEAATMRSFGPSVSMDGGLDVIRRGGRERGTTGGGRAFQVMLSLMRVELMVGSAQCFKAALSTSTLKASALYCPFLLKEGKCCIAEVCIFFQNRSRAGVCFASRTVRYSVCTLVDGSVLTFFFGGGADGGLTGGRGGKVCSSLKSAACDVPTESVLLEWW